MSLRKIIQEQSFVSFYVDDLKVGARLPFDVYIKDKGMNVHYLARGAVCTPAIKEDLKKRAVKEAYVNSKYGDVIADYIEKKGTLKDVFIDNPLVFQRYSLAKEEHLQIDRNCLVSGGVIPFRVYSFNKYQLTHITEELGDNEWKLPELSEIQGDLMISKQDIGLYSEYIKAFASIPQEDSETQVRLISLRENAKMMVKTLLDEPRQGDSIDDTKETVSSIIDCIIQDKDKSLHNYAIGSLDYYTYTHSLNVAILSIRMALEIGMRRSDIENLAIGALLHDIGKSSISPEIINRQGRLNSSEYKIIRMHVIEGEKIVRGYKGFHEDSIIPILQHHEKLTGNGYPNRLSGKDIRTFGRIAAIADCYDALTTSRPYRVANTPFYALSIIAKETGDFDPALLKVFIKMLGNVR